ncbi:MAG: ABC transporter permease subunit [Streptosporangiales bacterium]|nr:ABC transporter permease subunit [Streptosporangiales bacterium]
MTTPAESPADAEATAPEDPRPTKGRPIWLRLLLPVVIPVVVIAVWQYVGSRHLLAGGLFPSATACLDALWAWIFGGNQGDAVAGKWLSALGASTTRVALGFVIGTFLGVLLGLISGISWIGRRMVDPSVNAIRPISVTAWVPLALIIFGIGYRPAIFLTALATFFPVYVNTLSGARYAEGRLVQAARMLGARPSQITFRVVLPAALPNIVVGMRVAAAIAWTTVVVAEMLGAKSGLGYTLMYSYSQFKFDYVVAAMISIGAAGFATDKLLEYLAERRMSWVVGQSSDAA